MMKQIEPGNVRIPFLRIFSSESYLGHCSRGCFKIRFPRFSFAKFPRISTIKILREKAPPPGFWIVIWFFQTLSVRIFTHHSNKQNQTCSLLAILAI